MCWNGLDSSATERCKLTWMFLFGLDYLFCHSKIVLGCKMVMWGYMRGKGGVSFSLFLDLFFFSGYFWPSPDTGNWPVQLKCLQMTLSLAIIHTTLSPWLSLVKDIFPFIGSFLSLLSQGPCCLTTGREGATERAMGRGRKGEMGTMPAMKEQEKLNGKRN